MQKTLLTGSSGFLSGDARGRAFSSAIAFLLSLQFLPTPAIAKQNSVAAIEPPVIPLGLDAYRMLEKWPQQRLGVRAYMRSTYDRRGANEGADASHFLYQKADDFNVTLDVQGPGVLYFARYNHWHGSPWHYVVDGTDHIVRETSTADPNKPEAGSTFLPEDVLPNPLTWTWSDTKGADLMWVPIGFEKSFQMAYSRTRYGTGYYIYHQFAPGTKLSQPIKAWDGKTPPEKDVLELLGRSGRPLFPGGQLDGGSTFALSRGQSKVVARYDDGPRVIRHLRFMIPPQYAGQLHGVHLRVTWDGRKEPSIDAPLPLFFGAGRVYSRDGREDLVKAFPMNVRLSGDWFLECHFPMPFFRSARIELVNESADRIEGFCNVRSQPLDSPPAHVGYFHATYKDHGPDPELGKDLVLLDTREVEGGGDWSGSFVGTSWIFSHNAVLTTLEGDPRFYFDDSNSPQAYGTGTEEWGGGGDYWGGRNMTLPFAGHPCGAPSLKEARNDLDKVESAYRFLLADLMPFGKNARITLEHGGENDSKEHYETVTYWYGAPAPSLVKTDEFSVGDAASEKEHAYHSPQASEPYEVSSRYEWGVDTLSARAERPLKDPAHYAEFEFEAKGGVKYFIWVRGKGTAANNMTDASWLQFDDAVGTSRLGPGHAHPKAFGNWLDAVAPNTWAWSSALPNEPPQTVTFDRAGKHRLRVQPRHATHVIDRIWLSAARSALPERDVNPTTTGDLSEIVLSARDAVKLQGDVKRVDDAGGAGGKALSVGGATHIVIYPPHTDRGRTTKGTSEFTVKVRPDNFGALLRRKLDYAYPNQRAEVFVADASNGRQIAEGDWKPAGVWYLAGSNTCIYSNPPEELGATRHEVQTSNRRFRDDEFLIGREHTRGRSAIRVRVKFTPVDVPLFPGRAFPQEPAWSEMRYACYSYVMPDFKP